MGAAMRPIFAIAQDLENGVATSRQLTEEALDKIELAKNELALNKAVYELANQKKKSGLKSDVDLLFSKSEMMNSQKK